MESYRTMATRLRHPVNVALHTNAPLGVRIANAVTGFMGSWRFIILQTAIVVLWVAGNVYLVFHFDPYPFIFLNLNRTDSGGDSIVWRNMESWQRSATTDYAGIHRN